MMIGYCCSEATEELAQLLDYGCEKIVTFTPTDNAKDHFKTVLNQFKGEVIVVASFDSLHIQLVQWKQFVTMSQRLSIDVRFIPKDITVEVLWQLSENEVRIIRERTGRGLKQAKQQGRVGGRPKVSREKMNQIYYLYHQMKLPLREVASRCEVSLGTAYKYSEIRE